MELRRIVKEARSVFAGAGLYHLEPASLNGRAYPIDLDFTLDDEAQFYSPKDSNGIPQRHYSSVGVQYNATRIAAYALANYNRWIRRGEGSCEQNFRRCADWFASSPDGLFRYNFKWNSMEPGWISAMAQGEALSVLARAWLTWKDSRYRDQALRAVKPLETPLENGGVLSRVDGNHPFVEEYPEAHPRHTLNGFMYSLIGLADLELIAPDRPREFGVSTFVNTLEEILPKYDLGFWSTYDLHQARNGRRNPATIDYHSLHVAQLSYLGQKFRSSPILRVRDRWEQYQRSLTNRCRALLLKLNYRRVEKPQR